MNIQGKPYTPSEDTLQDFEIFCDDMNWILNPHLMFEVMTVRTLDCHVVGEETEETERFTLGGEPYYTYDR